MAVVLVVDDEFGLATWERLRVRYALEERGEIDVKGKGIMRTYLLSGRLGP